jgi:hypothetical protein
LKNIGPCLIFNPFIHYSLGTPQFLLRKTKKKLADIQHSGIGLLHFIRTERVFVRHPGECDTVHPFSALLPPAYRKEKMEPGHGFHPHDYAFFRSDCVAVFVFIGSAHG